MMDKNPTQVCPICQSVIKVGAKAVRCATCAAIVHHDCWELNGRCSTRGCEGTAEPYTINGDTPVMNGQLQGVPNYPPEDPEVERLLAAAYAAASQGQDARVTELLREAKEHAPEHPGVLELEGDFALAAGRLRDAETLYYRAFAADPSNALIEEKYASVMVRLKEPQFLATLPPDDEDQPFLWVRRVPRNPWASAALSALFPGLGQWYNGDLVKGAITLLVGAICSAWVFWPIAAYVVPLWFQQNKGVSVERISIDHLVAMAFQGWNIVVVAVWSGVWIFSVVDAALIAHKSNEEAKAWRLTHPSPPRPTTLVPPTKPPT